MESRTYLKRAILFVLVGLVIYLGFYLLSEKLVYKHTLRNRFFIARTTPPCSADYVILGASHAMILSFEDMNKKLEEMTGTKIVNLATLGSGIVPNRLFLDYFLLRHNTKGVIYLLDSGVFMKREANEGRLDDSKLFNRAPFDPELLALLRSYHARGLVGVNPILDYAAGFSKVSNGKRFSPDLHEMELIFGKRYRPNLKEIKTRIASTDPALIDEKLFGRYLDLLAEMIDALKARGIRVIACRPALPGMYLENKPHEDLFDQRIKAVLEPRQVPFQDFSKTIPEYRYYFDTDHLNRFGVPIFFERHFKQFLIENGPTRATLPSPPQAGKGLG